jgi:hypothetical protein
LQRIDDGAQLLGRGIDRAVNCSIESLGTLTLVVDLGIDDLVVRGFGNQNVIAGLSILDIRSRQLELLRFEVSIEGSFGTSINFLCRDAAVDHVEPWELVRHK